MSNDKFLESLISLIEKYDKEIGNTYIGNHIRNEILERLSASRPVEGLPPDSVGWIIPTKTGTINSILTAALRFLDIEQMIILRDALTERTPAASRPVESDAVWISVNDRYPTSNDKPVYLTFHPIQWEGDYEVTQAGFTSADAGIWPVVTHWMPLPAPSTIP